MAPVVAKENNATEAGVFRTQRLAMVERSISARGVREDLVLDAMRKVPRELFVPFGV